MAMVGTNASNFDESVIGLVLGALLLFYGISGVIYSQIYSSLYASNLDGFMLFILLTCASINGVGILVVKKYPLKKVYRIDPVIELSVSYASPTNALVIEDLAPEKSPLLIREDMTPKQILFSRIFWFYALSTILQQGLTYMVNINAIIRASLGPNATPTDLISRTSLHITLISTFQSIGRFAFGAGSDLIAKYNISRTVLLAVAQSLLFLGSLILACISDFSTLTSSPILVICSTLIGLGWYAKLSLILRGAAAGLFPPLTRSLFGLKFYGTASAFVMSGVPIGIFSFNYLFGSVYDKQLAIQAANGGPSDYCYGVNCFRIAFISTTSVQALVTVLSVMLYFSANSKIQVRRSCD